MVSNLAKARKIEDILVKHLLRADDLVIVSPFIIRWTERTKWKYSQNSDYVLMYLICVKRLIKYFDHMLMVSRRKTMVNYVLNARLFEQVLAHIWVWTKLCLCTAELFVHSLQFIRLWCKFWKPVVKRLTVAYNRLYLIKMQYFCFHECISVLV